MRIIRLSTCYEAYLNSYFQDNPCSRKTYDQIYDEFMHDGYGWANHWSQALRHLGYEMWEPVCNARSMQEQWAEENSAAYRKEHWFSDIIRKQVAHFKPEVVLFNDYQSFAPSFIRELRRHNPGIRAVLGWCGAPYFSTDIFREYDAVITNIPELKTRFEADGLRTFMMKHAFSKQVLERLGAVEPCEDFTFLGHIIVCAGFHNERMKIVAELLRKTNLRIYGNFHDFSKPKRDRSFLTSLWRKMVNFWTTDSLFAATQPGLFGLAMFRKLAESRITLNTHIDISTSSANNMRLFEATGIGVCLLTDWKPDLDETFEVDREVAVYRSVDEAIDKVKYLQEHDKVRTQIARDGQQRTLRDHSFEQRAPRLDEIIKACLH